MPNTTNTNNSRTGLLPIQYRIEIYEDSFTNDPTVSFETSDVPFSIHAGDYMTHSTWPMQPSNEVPQGKVVRVKAVQHLLWKIDGSHVGHSLSVCVEIVDKPEDVF